ncbi:cytochrome P450 [Artemisia annua]|uniref:Cytochrome P450 n=1 Tax=Artemisia annua TaxID=35608 RepID=A0A2U1K9L6_ARTAN|nr:cytochrome P450 [Artemisia annua]
MELVGKPNLSDFFPILAWLDLQSVERDMKRELQHLDRIFNMFIDGRIKANSKESKEALQHEGKKDFLQILLELKDQKETTTSLSMTQIKALLMGEEHDLSEKFGITLRKRKPLMAVPSQRLSNVSLYK